MPLAVTLPFLREVAILLVASVGIAYLCYRLRLVPIVGFLLAGVLVGPGALGLVDDGDFVRQAAEVGVILLLFTIGVEFSLEKLARIGRAIFLGGGVQTLGTTALVAGLLAALGVEVGPAVFTGFLVALSSTAIVLKLLAERAETDTPPGRLTLAVLIFQDLAVVVMVLLVPTLAGAGGSALDTAWALGKAALVVAFVLVGARRAIPWMLDRLAKTRRTELLLLAVVAVCFGTAWLTSLAGVSLALGAFLAGLVVSESHYAEAAVADVLPLQTVFNAVFFVSIGMLLDVGFVAANLGLVLAAVVGVFAIKALLVALAVLVLKWPARTATAVALARAPIGEFSFVLVLEGNRFGLTPGGLGADGEQLFVATAVVLMLLTPFLLAAGPRLGERLGRRWPGSAPETVEAEVEMEDHTIVVGYGPAGQRLGRVLHNTGIPFVVVDLNPENVEAAQEAGFEAFYGDIGRHHLLETVGVERAKVCVVAINDRTATERAIRLARYHNPTLQIIVRSRFIADVEPLHEAGADVVVPEELETTVRLFSQVLGSYFVPPDEVARQVSLVRAGDYEVLRGSIQEAHLMVLQGLDEEGLHTRAVAVRAGAPAAGATLADLALRRRHGLTVLAVRRGRETIGSPAGDFHVEAGDRLVLVGAAAQFAACADLFRTPEPVE
ncbi:MAG: cation:proton antiporter [Bacteroidota bacterium]